MIDAVLVPPSALSTSQSSSIDTSPSVERSVTARSARPISLCISCVRPPTLFLSRRTRSLVDRGSIAYSAVTHPVPLPRIHGGTRPSTVAVQMTRVSPVSIRADPSASGTYPEMIFTGRCSDAERPPDRDRVTWDKFIFPWMTSKRV